MNVQEQISLFRNYANERPYATDTTESALFWRTADIMEYLNQAKTHYNALLNNLDESYNIGIFEIASADVSIVNGNLLPVNLQKIKLVTYFDPADKTGQNAEVEIKPIDLTAKTRNNNYASPATWGISAKWYFQGNLLKFVNWFDNTTRNIRVYYLMSLPELKNYNDIPQLPEIIHENMVIYGLIKGLLRDKQATLANYWQGILKIKDEFVINTLKPRQVQEPNHAQQREDWEDTYYNRY